LSFSGKDPAKIIYFRYWEFIMEKLRDIQLSKLTERAKELKCIYRIMEILHQEDRDLGHVFNDIIEAIPPGWQHPTICEAQIIFEGRAYKSHDFNLTSWMQVSDIVIDNHVAGSIHVCYLHNIEGSSNPFLPEEQKLLNTIAEKLSSYIYSQRLKKTMELIKSGVDPSAKKKGGTLLDFESDAHWKWRYQAAEQIARAMDLERFGVEALYIIGSTKSGSAGPGSDIDLLVHFAGTQQQREILVAWLQGWGEGLAEVNFLRTGYKVEGGIIDFHIITDEDIHKKTSYAVMIGSQENSARLLKSK